MRSTRNRRGGSAWRGAVLLLVVVSLVPIGQGCGGKTENGTAPEAETETAGSPAAASYPAALSAASTPSEVARVLVQALDAQNKATLLGLVATKAATEQVDAIYKKYGKRSPIKPEANAALAAGGWLATYSFVQSGQTEVKGERITGESATVTAAAKGPDGTARTLMIKLVREERVWKVLPGIETE